MYWSEIVYYAASLLLWSLKRKTPYYPPPSHAECFDLILRSAVFARHGNTDSSRIEGSTAQYETVRATTFEIIFPFFAGWLAAFSSEAHSGTASGKVYHPRVVKMWYSVHLNVFHVVIRLSLIDTIRDAFLRHLRLEVWCIVKIIPSAVLPANFLINCLLGG